MSLKRGEICLSGDCLRRDNTGSHADFLSVADLVRENENAEIWVKSEHPAPKSFV